MVQNIENISEWNCSVYATVCIVCFYGLVLAVRLLQLPVDKRPIKNFRNKTDLQSRMVAWQVSMLGRPACLKIPEIIK